MFFFWPTINDATLSGERRDWKLRDLESHMDAFLAEKGAEACPRVLDNVRRTRSQIRKEVRHPVANAVEHKVAV